jgi:hypothetical protein
MNISEFERTKPTETMRSLNILIKKMKSLKEMSINSPWEEKQYEMIYDSLIDIKNKLKNGE